MKDDRDVIEDMKREAINLRAAFEDFALAHGSRPNEAACRDLVAVMNGFGAWAKVLELAEGTRVLDRLQSQAEKLHAVIEKLLLKRGPYPSWLDCLNTVAKTYGHGNWHAAIATQLRKDWRHRTREGWLDDELRLSGLLAVLTPSPYPKEGEYGHGRPQRFPTDGPILGSSKIESIRFAWADESAYARAQAELAAYEEKYGFIDEVALEGLCRRLIEQVPFFLPAHAMLVFAMAQQGRVREAIKWFYDVLTAVRNALPSGFDGWIPPDFEENRVFRSFVRSGLVTIYSESESEADHEKASAIASWMIESWILDGSMFYALQSKEHFDKSEALQEVAQDMGVGFRELEAHGLLGGR